MLGAAAAAFQGQAGAALTYTGRVIGFAPDWYVPLGDMTATALIGAHGTYVNNPQLGVDPIAQDDPGGRSVGPNGATTNTPHIIATTPLTGPDLTIDMIVQLDDLDKSKHVLVTTALLDDGFSIEVLSGGQVRAFSRVGSTAHPFVGEVGDVPQGETVKVTYQRQSNLSGWSQRVYINGVLKAEDPTQRTWGTIAAGTVYIGTWWSGSAFLDPTDGLIAHVAGWNPLLSAVQIADLVRTNSIAWAENIDAGSVNASASKMVSVRQGGWHGKLPLTVSAGNGSLVTTSESGENITIEAGATTGIDDTFTYSFTDANDNTSPSRTVTVDVTEAATAQFTIPVAPSAPSAEPRQLADPRRQHRDVRCDMGGGT